MTDSPKALVDELAGALAVLIEGCTARGKGGKPIGTRFPRREELDEGHAALARYNASKEKPDG